MRAARYYGYRDLRVETVPEPQPGPGEVKVRVAWAGICGTDRHEYTGPVFVPVGRIHRVTGRTAPLVLGHEFAGVVAEAGEGVTAWRPGDRVTERLPLRRSYFGRAMVRSVLAGVEVWPPTTGRPSGVRAMVVPRCSPFGDAA